MTQSVKNRILLKVHLWTLLFGACCLFVVSQQRPTKTDAMHLSTTIKTPPVNLQVIRQRK